MELLFEMEDHEAELYAKKWSLESQIEGSGTSEELGGIKW